MLADTEGAELTGVFIGYTHSFCEFKPVVGAIILAAQDQTGGIEIGDLQDLERGL